MCLFLSLLITNGLLQHWAFTCDIKISILCIHSHTFIHTPLFPNFQVFLLLLLTSWPDPLLLLISIQFSCSVVSDSLRPHGLQHPRLPCPSLSPGACSVSCSLSQSCYWPISTSVALFSCCLQSFPASGSFVMSQFFTSGGQSTGASASASVLPTNAQDWFPLGLTDLISLQSKGLSRVFSNTPVQKHQFFSAQPSYWSNSHIHTWLLEKP